MNILIVSGGSIDDAFALQFIKEHTFEYIIAVDKGTAFLYRAGIRPSILTGDFDTLDAETLSKYEAAGFPIRKFKPEKDAADIEIALGLAKDKTDKWEAEHAGQRADAWRGENSGQKAGAGLGENACQEDPYITTWILGGTGTRLDHMIGTIYAMAGMGEKYDVRLIDPNNILRIIRPGTHIFRRDEQYGKYLSFLPLGGQVIGVTMTGMKYPLSGAILTPDNTLGVSNEIQEETGILTFESGILICIQSRD